MLKDRWNEFCSISFLLIATRTYTYTHTHTFLSILTTTLGFNDPWIILKSFASLHRLAMVDVNPVYLVIEIRNGGGGSLLSPRWENRDVPRFKSLRVTEKLPWSMEFSHGNQKELRGWEREKCYRFIYISDISTILSLGRGKSSR